MESFTNGLHTKEEETRKLRKQTNGCQKGRIGARDREFGMDMYTLLYLKWITNKALLYSTWHLGMGGEFGGE